jgi:TolB-like protein
MRRAFVVFFFAATAFAQERQTVGDGIPHLASSIVAGISREHKPRVAVLPFDELHGPHTAFGVYVAEALTTQLVNGGVDVVERSVVERALAKRGIASAAGIDAETARSLGDETHVEAIIFGTIADMDSAIAVNARVRDAATGRIITAAEVILTRDGRVEGLLAQLLQPAGDNAPAPAPAGGPEPRNLTWNDGEVRVTIESQERRRDTVEMALLFANPTGKALLFNAHRYSLVDEKGDEYTYGYDTKDFVGKGVRVAGGKHDRSSFFFVCHAGDCSGKIFSVRDAAGAVVVKNLTIVP